MPKLPAFFQRATPPATPSTKQDLHQGRKRTIPHRENSWATYVYFQGLSPNSFFDLQEKRALTHTHIYFS